MRPAKFIVNLCRAFPKTEFRILKHAEDDHSPQAINPKSIMSLVAGSFSDGKEVTVEIDGKCEIMASEFFKVAWENLLNYSDDTKAAEQRLKSLIDEAFLKIHDPDVESIGAEFTIATSVSIAELEEEYRSVAVINDRLHNLSLAIIPRIARYSSSN